MTDQTTIDITVTLAVSDITATLIENGFKPSNDNIQAVAEGLADKWATDVTESNDYDFIVEVLSEDLE